MHYLQQQQKCSTGFASQAEAAELCRFSSHIDGLECILHALRYSGVLGDLMRYGVSSSSSTAQALPHRLRLQSCVAFSSHVDDLECILVLVLLE